MVDGTFSSGWFDQSESHDIETIAAVESSVLVAKPSPEKTAEINWGPPSAVPNKPGCVFPYFHGMFIPDAPHLRDLVSQLFFRLFPTDKDGSPRAAWAVFRLASMSLAATPEGMLLTHMLIGCKLALDSQARMFVLFADGEYKGFCLLGECFRVYHSNLEIAPLSADDLRKELKSIPTKEQAATDLAVSLMAATYIGGDTYSVTTDDSKDVFTVAHLLANIDLEETEDDDIEAIRNALKKMAFRNEYKSYSPSSIASTINDLLLHQQGLTTWEKIPFYIPFKDWNGIDDPVYQILARFGSSSFSFVSSSRGDWIKIPEKLEEGKPGVFSVEESSTNKVYYYDKPVKRAVQDWKELVDEGGIKYDVTERAGSVKAQSFSGPSRMPIVLALIDGVHRKVYEPVGEKKKGKSKVENSAFKLAPPDFDKDFEFTL